MNLLTTFILGKEQENIKHWNIALTRTKFYLNSFDEAKKKMASLLTNFKS